MVRCRDAFRAAALLLLAAGQLFAQAQQAGPQLYFFTMDGCPPCAAVRPEMDQLQAAGYPVTTIDARQNPEWARQFEVATTPTLVLVAGNQVVHRHSGIVTAREVVGWFQWLAAQQNQNRQAAPETEAEPESAADPTGSDRAPLAAGSTIDQEFVAATGAEPTSAADWVRNAGHTGGVPSSLPSSTAGSAREAAMRATVRLKVEDEGGISFATGTVIHAHGNEAVVLTCGHVFREAGGGGQITADIGWGDDQPPVTVPGKLLDFDAGPRDVGLVLVFCDREMTPVRVAPPDAPVTPGLAVFSIGCDQGSPPTIRETQIKDLAIYDGVRKYDIFGRPAVGRSGGGLFTEQGELVGVCNAAAVDFDEGIYSSLPNIWSELAMTRMDRVLAARATVQPGLQSAGSPSNPLGSRTDSTLAAAPLPPDQPFLQADRIEAGWDAGERPAMTQVVNNGQAGDVSAPGAGRRGGQELIVILRDHVTGENRTHVIVDPEPGLVEQLHRAAGSTMVAGANGAEAGFARLRETMPEYVDRSAHASQTLRAQSPEPAPVR